MREINSLNLWRKVDVLERDFKKLLKRVEEIENARIERPVEDNVHLSGEKAKRGRPRKVHA